MATPPHNGAERGAAPQPNASHGSAAGESILLRREIEADELDKACDLAREVQLGCEKFEHAVFIDNDSSEADVQRILAKEATRQLSFSRVVSPSLLRG